MSPATCLNILLIEDNPADADFLQEIAEELDTCIWNITHVERLADGLAHLQTQVFDIILLDLSLPDAQGLGMIPQIQQITPLVPIVVLTGWNDERVGVEALRCGVQDFLVKGQIEPWWLVRTVHFAIERVRAQQVIQQQSTAISAARDGIAILNANWHYTYVNQAYAAIYGYNSPEDLLGQSWEHAYHPSELQRITSHLWPAITVTGHWTGEALGQTQLNQAFYQDLSVTALTDGGYVCTVRDMTDRQQTHVALQKSEQKFRTLVSNIPGVIYRCLPESPWTVMFVSDGIETLSGYPASAFLKRELLYLWQLCHPEDQYRTQQAVAEALANHQPFVLEYRLVTKEGQIRWVYEKGQGIWNQNGTLLYLDGVIFDISDRKAAEERVLRSLEREKELSELKSRFITTASHEFRTPLTTILGSAELLEHSGHKWSVEKQHHYFAQIKTAVHHMIQLMDNLLVLSRAEADRVPFHPTAIDLPAFCQSIIKTIQSGLRQPRVIHFTSELNNPIVYVDEQLMRQILQNLLSNALKFSPHPTEIDLTLHGDEQMIQIQFQDQGIGVPLSDQSRLFESFHRGTNVGTIAGTGFGLTIAKRAVELHHGKITVDSGLNQGSKFTVTLPRYPIPQIH